MHGERPERNHDDLRLVRALQRSGASLHAANLRHGRDAVHFPKPNAANAASDATSALQLDSQRLGEHHHQSLRFGGPLQRIDRHVHSTCLPGARSDALRFPGGRATSDTAPAVCRRPNRLGQHHHRTVRQRGAVRSGHGYMHPADLCPW